MVRKERRVTDCEWCGQPMDPDRHIVTGLSGDHICMECSGQCDELGYDTNEM
jgi:hypothetical protein